METPPLDPPPAGRWLTKPEAAEFFGKSERTIRHWLDCGKLHGYQEPGKGFVTWRIWSIEGEKGPTVEAETALLPALVPPLTDVVTIAREQFSELLARHEIACTRIGALEEVLRDRLPPLEATLPALAEGTESLREEVKQLAAAGEGERRRIGRRLLGVAAALMVLAVLLAVVGGMVLTRSPRRPPRGYSRPRRSSKGTTPTLRSLPLQPASLDPAHSPWPSPARRPAPSPGR